MTKLNKIIALGALTLTVGTTSLTALAASNYNSPAEALAGLTNTTVEDITAKKAETDSTYGAMAKEADTLEAFKTEVLEIKKTNLEEQVENDILTQEEADEALATFMENQANCDGQGSGQRNGQGRGKGLGLGNGSCQR
jgi:hypothetical protein